MNRRSFLKVAGLITGAVILNPIKIISKVVKPDWNMKISKEGFVIKDWNGIESGGMSFINNTLIIEGKYEP